MTTDVNGLSSLEKLTNFDYFFKTVGYSLAITSIILLAVYLINFIQKKRQSSHLKTVVVPHDLQVLRTDHPVVCSTNKAGQ